MINWKMNWMMSGAVPDLTLVVAANTNDCFKTRLDKFWNSQDVKCDYEIQTKFDRRLHNINDYIILTHVYLNTVHSW